MISPSDVRRIRRWRHRQMIRRAIPYLNSAMAMIAIAVVFFIAVVRL